MFCLKKGKYKKKALFIQLGLILFYSSLSFGRELIDFTQTQIVFPDEPKRVVTLAPSLGELVADLAGEKVIVGVSDYSDYPPSLKKIESIGAYFKFNIEKVVSLKPDLVLATLDGNSKQQILHLRGLGIPVLTVGTENFSDIQNSIRLVAKALNKESEGRQMASQLAVGIERFKKKALTRAHPKVLVQVGESPLIVAGQKSFLNEALKVVGGENVYSELKDHYPRPSLEDAVRRNPDVILILVFGEKSPAYQKIAQNWLQFSQISAVKNKRIIILKSDELLRPTLRLLEGLSLLEKALYDKK